LQDRDEENRRPASMQARSTDARNELPSAAQDWILGLVSGRGTGMEEECNEPRMGGRGGLCPYKQREVLTVGFGRFGKVGSIGGLWLVQEDGGEGEWDPGGGLVG
jgi:hypothetical protein